MSDHPEIIIIKRKGGHGDGHHGGAWKIAFADFMTAMMAFFLVLWIINATDKDTRSVIARYFNPVQIENPARARKGLHGVDKTKIVSNEKEGDQIPDTEPGDNNGMPAKGETKSKDNDTGRTETKGTPRSESKQDSKGGGKEEKPGATGDSAKKEDKAKTPANQPHPDPRDAADVMPTMSETALFSDPYAALDKISGGRAANSPAPPPDTGYADPSRLSGANSIEAFRDPFKPIGPGIEADPMSTDYEATRKQFDARPDLAPQKGVAASPTPVEAEAPPTSEASALPQPAGATPPPPPPVAKPSPAPTKDAAASPATPAAPVKSAVASKASDPVKELMQKLAPLQAQGSGPAIDVQATKEGLLISLTDKLSFSMFAIGSAEPRAEVVKAMETIADALKSRSDGIIVRGYTDGRPYKSGVYDNWRLSSDRAQMAYYMLMRAGVPEARIQRIEGHGDHDLRDAAHPLAAENRRIEILVRDAKP